MWTDTHCHLDDERIVGGAAAGITRAIGAGVSTMITIGTDAAHSAAAIALAAEHDSVWATVGLHPHDAINGIDSVSPLLDRPKVVAVGECGLDYHYDHSPRDTQRDVFAAHIALARERKLALVVHTREAWDDTFDILRAVGAPERLIFHCFSGGVGEAKRCLDLGAYLSFSGIVTFKTAGDIREAAALCTSDRVLVETDSPYLTPVPHRGRPNEPAYVPLVGKMLAGVREVELEGFANQTTLNASVAFALPRT
jgi:TatD DNase family protein